MDRRSNEILIVESQTTNDIIKHICLKHIKCIKEYDEISKKFASGSDNWELSKRLFDYCKRNIAYRIETEERQTISRPSTILANKQGDCKHYALFIAGVIDSLKRQGRKIDWCFRFANYDFFRTSPEHVFIVVFDHDDEIWIDPVMRIFDYKKPYIFKIDKFVDTMPFVAGYETRRIAGMAMGAAPVGPSQSDLNASGIYFALKVFANQNLTPAAATELINNPPFVFVLNGLRYNLPPENKINGGLVPPLPVGLTVQYAPSFLGVPIPAYMLKPFVNTGNRLQIAPLQISPTAPFSTDSSVGNQTNALLVGNNKVLLNLIMSVMGSLVNSFSSHPWANNFGSLSHYILDLRNKDNYLDPVATKTIAGVVLQGAAQYVLPVAEAVVSVIVPVAAPFIAAGASVLNPALNKATGYAKDSNQNLIKSSTFVDASGQIQSTDPAIQSAAAAAATNTGIIPGVPNNYLLIAAAAAALLLMSGGKKSRSKSKSKKRKR